MVKVNQPRVRNVNISPSKVYARSPYRPTAILDGHSQNYINQLNQAVIMATNPFQVGDKEVIDYIRRTEGIDSGSWHTGVGIYGGLAGAAAASVFASTMFSTGTKTITAGAGMIATGAGVVPGALVIAGGLLQYLAGAGTLAAGYLVGKTASQMALTPEGRAFSKQYFRNLGNSFSARPISTVLTTASSIAYPIFRSKLPLNELPQVQTFIYMYVNKGLNLFGNFVDKELFGEMTYQQQISYTTLSASVGDVFDMADGNPVIRGALMAAIPNKDTDVIEKIGAAYGMTDEYDPFAFADLRTELGVDLGTFGNGIVDIIGEIVVDGGFISGGIQSSQKDKINQYLVAEFYTKALKDPNGIEAKILMDEDWGSVEGYQKIKEQLDSRMSGSKEFQKKISESKTTEEKIKVRKEFLGSLLRTELYDLYKGLDKKPGHANSKTKKEDLIDLLSGMSDEELIMKIENQYKKTRESKVEGLRTEGHKPTYKDSKIGKTLSNQKILNRILGNYASKFTPETAARNKDQLTKIKAENKNLALLVVGELGLFLREQGVSEVDILLFSRSIHSFLEEQTSIYDNDMNKKQSKKQEITENINKVMEDIHAKGDGSYFETSGFSFDSMVAKTAIENGYKAGSRITDKLMNTLPQWRFQEERKDKFVNALTWIVDPITRGTRWGARKALNKIKSNKTNNGFEKAKISKEALEEHRISLDRFKEISKIEDEIYKQTVEKYNQILEDSLNKTLDKKLNKEIEDLNKEIMELQKQYNDGTLTADEIEEVKQKEKELVSLYEDKKKEHLEKQNLALQELYKNDPVFRTYFRTIEKLRAEIDANEEAIQMARRIVSSQRVEWKHVDKENSKGETTYTYVNEYNESKALKRLNHLKSLRDMGSLDGEDTEELTNLEIHYGEYMFIKENKEKMIGVLETKRSILHSVMGLEMRFSGATFAINSMTHKLLKYGPHKALTGITVDQYGKLRDLYSQINKEGLTESQINEIVSKSGFSLEQINEIGKLDKETKAILDESFNKKSDPTQQEVIRMAEEQSQVLYGDREIFAVGAEDQMKSQLVEFLGETLAEQVLETIRNNGDIKLDLNYHIEFLNFFNPTVKKGTEDEIYSRFILNDRKLADFINKSLEGDAVKKMLDILSPQIKYEGTTRTYSTKDKQRTNRHLKTFSDLHLKPLLKDMRDKGLITNGEFKHLESNIQYLATAIVATHKKMSYYKDKGQEGYSIKFNNASQTQIGAWLLNKFKEENPEWETIHQYVDLQMYELNRQLEALETDAFKKAIAGSNYLPIENVRELLKRQTISLFSSDIIKAMGHDYTRWGALKDFYNEGVEPFDKSKLKLTKEQTDRMNEELKDIEKELVITDTSRIATDIALTNFLENSENDEALKAIGLNVERLRSLVGEDSDGKKYLKPRNFSTSSFTQEELENKRAIDKLDDHNKLIIETVIAEFRKNNEHLSDEEVESLEKELLEKLTVVAKQEQRKLYNKKTEEYRAELREESDKKFEDGVFDSTMLKYLHKAGFHQYVDFNNIHKVVRGNRDRIPGNIVFDRNDGDQTHKSEVMKITNGEYVKGEDGKEVFVKSLPTPENIEKLLNLKDKGVFKNHFGVKVNLTSLKQLEHSGVLNKEWLDALHEDFEVEVDGKTIKMEDLDIAHFAFLRGLDQDDLLINDQFYQEALANSVNIPSKIRKQRLLEKEENNKDTKPKFKKVYKGDLSGINEKALKSQNIVKGSILSDLLNEIVGGDDAGLLTSFEMEVSDERKFIEDGKETSYRILRLLGGTKESPTSFELYVPESFNIDGKNDDERDRKTYIIKGNEYIRQRVVGENDATESVLYIVKEIINELQYGFSSHKQINGDDVPFELRASQRSLFNIFFDQRFTNIGFKESEISEFLWVNPENNDYQKELMYHEDRLDDYTASLAVANNELFVNVIKDINEDYSFRSVSQNPKSIYLKREMIIDEEGNTGKVDLNDIFLPYNRNTKEVQRGSIVLNAIKNQKRIAGSESPLVQTIVNKFNPEYSEKYNRGGINLKTHINDYHFKGKSNYQDATLVSESAIRRMYGIGEGEPIPPEAIKLINRHSSKQSAIIVSDKEMKEITGEDGIEITISRSSMVRRGLYGMMQEIYDTKDYDPNGDWETKYVDNNENLTINSKNASGVTSGYVYYYLTDHVDFGRENEDGTGKGWKTSRENFDFLDSKGESILHRGLPELDDILQDGPNYNSMVKLKYKLKYLMDGRLKDRSVTRYLPYEDPVEGKEPQARERIIFYKEEDKLMAKTEVYDFKKGKWQLLQGSFEEVKIEQRDVDGITLGIEELDTFESLKYIRDSEGNILDEEGIFVEWIYQNSYNSITDDKKMQRLYNSTVNVSGKPGYIKSRFAKRSISHSGYNVILPDTLSELNKETMIDNGLEGNVIVMPAEQAVRAGMAYRDEEGKYHFMDVDNAQEGIVLRYPTTGRQSFIHFQIVLDDNPNRSKAVRLSTSMHKLLNADHDGDRVAWFSLMGATDDVVNISRKAFGHNYGDDEADYSDFASRPGFQKDARVNRDTVSIVEEEAGKVLNDKGEWEYSQETKDKYTKFLDDAGKVKHEDEAYEQSFEKQKTLKEYSAYLTGLFDQQLQMFLNSKENQEWFDGLFDESKQERFKKQLEKIENTPEDERTEAQKKMYQSIKSEIEAREKLDALKVSDFPSLIYLMKQLYSQRTFDFSKWGKEEHKISFELVYKSARTITQENFMTHVARLLNVVEADVRLTGQLEENLKNMEEENESIEKQYIKEYKESLESETNSILVELNNMEADYKDRADIDEVNLEYLDMESYNVFAEADETLTNRHISQKELNDLAEKHNMDINSEKYIEELYNLTSDTEQFARAMKLGYNMDWNIENQPVNQVFRDMADIMIKNLKDDVTGMRRLEGTEFFGLFNTIKNSLYKTLDRVGVFDPGALNQLVYTLISKDGQKVTIPLTDLFYVYEEDRYGRPRRIKITPGNANQYLSPENRNKYRINLDSEKIGLFNNNLMTFYIDSSNVFIDEEEIFKMNQNLFNDIDNEIVKFYGKTGKNRVAGLTPLLFGKAAYEGKIDHNLFLDLSNLFTVDSEGNQRKELDPNYKPKSQLGIALKALGTENYDFVEKAFNALKGYMGFNVFAEQVSGGSVDNMTRILFEGGIGRYEETPPEARVATPKEFISLINNYDIIRMTEENYKDVIRIFRDNTSEMYMKKNNLTEDDRDDVVIMSDMHQLLLDMIRIFNKNNFNPKNNFFENNFLFKMNYITNLQNVKYGSMLGDNTDYGFTEDDLNSMEGRSTIEKADQREIDRIYSLVAEAMDNPNIVGGDKISKSIMFEQNARYEVLKTIKELGRDLQRHISSDESLYNNNGYYNYDQSKTKYVYFKKNLEGKRLTDILTSLSKVYYSKFDLEGSQTEIAKEVQKMSENKKISQNLLSLYIDATGSTKDYIESVESMIESINLEGYPLNLRILQQTLLMNKLQHSLDPSLPPILPHTIRNIGQAIYSNLSLEQKDIDGLEDINLKGITMNNIYSKFYRDFKLQMIEEPEINNNGVLLTKEETDFLEFLGSGNTQTFGLENLSFMQVMFGKILYDKHVQEVEQEFFEHKWDKMSVQEQVDFKENFAKEMAEDIKIQKDLIEDKLFKTSNDAVEEIIDRDLFDEDDLTKFFEEQYKEEFIKEKDNLKKIQKAITTYKEESKSKLKKDKIVDTYFASIASNVFGMELTYTNEDGEEVEDTFTFSSKGLRNVHYQLSLLTQGVGIQDNKALAEDIADRYKDHLERNGVDIKNKRLHTAMIDSLITHEVLMMFGHEKSKQLLDGLDDKNREAILDYLNNRKNYAIFDNETKVTSNIRKQKIYELSYITFDDQGLPIPKQHFFYEKLDEPTIIFLKGKGFSDDEIENIKEEMLKDPYFNKKENDIKQFLKDVEGKKLVGHNVEGDIDQINNDYEAIIRKRLRKSIEFGFVDEDQFIKDIDGMTTDELRIHFEGKSDEDILKMQEELSDEIVQRYKDHRWKNNKEFQGRLYKGLLAQMHLRVKEEFLRNSNIVYDENEKERYATMMTQLGDLFVTSRNSHEFKDSIMRVLKQANPNTPINIDDEALSIIVQKYEDALTKLRSEGSFMFRFMDSEIGEFGQLIPKETELLGIGKITEDDDPFFRESMYKLQAFYSIIDELKRVVDFNGLSYKQYEALNYMNKEMDQDQNIINYFNSLPEDSMTKHYYNDYLEAKASGDQVAEFLSLQKAKAAYRTRNVSDDLGLSQVPFTYDDLEDFLNDLNSNDPKVMKISQSDMNRILQDHLMQTSRVQSGLEPKQKDQATKLKIIGHSILKLGKDALNFDTFMGLFDSGAANNPDLMRRLFNQFTENYNSMKQGGHKIYTHNQTLVSNIDYSEEQDRTFIQFAFYSLAGKSNELQDFFFDLIDEDFDLEDNYYSEYENDNDMRRIFQERVEEIYAPVKELVSNRKSENVYNKSNFSKTRMEFKNKILKGLYSGDWDELKSYLNNSPLGTNPDEFINYLNGKLQELIANGIPQYKQEYYIDSEGNLNYKTETGTTINYDENNNKLRLRFIKHLLDQEYKLINSELYVDTIRLTADINNDANEKVTFSEYNKNINKYGGYNYKSSFMKDHEMKTGLDEAQKYIRSTTNKLDQLSKYQGNFLDYIASYRKDDGTYYVDALYEAMTKGYLGQNFKVTLISDIHEEGAKGRSKLDEDKFGILQNDLDEIVSTVGGKAFLENLKNTNSPVMKIFEVKTKEDLEYLLSIAEDTVGLGFSSNWQVYEANKMSYENYELPKHIRKIEQSITKMQKFMATLSPGFLAKMLYNNTMKNAVRYLGSDSPMVKNLNFFRHAAKVADIDGQYGNMTAQHMANSGDLLEMARQYNDLLKAGVVTENDMAKFIENSTNFITPKIAALKHFLEVYIPEEGISDRRMISDEFTEAAELLHQLESSLEIIQGIETSTNLEFAIAEINQILIRLGNAYHQSNYRTRLVMLAGQENSTFKFYSANKEDRDKVLETFNILSLIDKTERMNMMHTPFDLSGAKDTVDFYQLMKNKSKKEVGDGLILAGIDWIVNDSKTGNLRKNLMNKITRHSRIHGLLLDMYVNGEGHDQAIASSLHRFFNFGDKSPLERDMAIFYPFAGYFIRDLDYQLDMMVNPKYMRLMSNIHQGMQSWYERDEDDDETLSPWYARLVENQGWVPMGKNWGMKIGNPMHSAIHALKNPYEAMEQRKNPLIRGIESLVQGDGFNASYHASLAPITNSASAIQKVIGGNVRNPADIMPSLFYQDSSGYKKYTPRNYRINYDYRNLNRELFFEDGSRRTPSRNPYTTAKNIRYRALVNRSINRRNR